MRGRTTDSREQTRSQVKAHPVAKRREPKRGSVRAK
jgi:hypothetical protein